MPALGLFDTVPAKDALNFGIGQNFRADRVRDFLDLKKTDISRVAGVSLKSVRLDNAIPGAVRERLEEIGSTCNMVAEAFNGDLEKTALWFKTKNPLLGDVSPRDMVRLGRFDRLRRVVLGAMAASSWPDAWLTKIQPQKAHEATGDEEETSPRCAGRE